MISKMIPLKSLPLVLLLAGMDPRTVLSLSSSAAQVTRSRLADAFSSPSGKLTLSPEIAIPEPSNPTAILLQATAVAGLSNKIRTKAKANAAWISANSVSTLKTFCNEQEDARGNFPGPVPVVYCEPQAEAPSNDEALCIETGTAKIAIGLADVAAAGACGVCLPVCSGNVVSSLEDIGNSESAWVANCKDILEHGLQPIPEVSIADVTAARWSENEMEVVVQKISDLIGQDPVCVLVTVIPTAADTADKDGDESEKADMPLPTISKALGKRVPILSSVRTTAGENRLAEESARIKAAGFNGAVLRRECIPGYQVNLSLEYVASFWSACIGDLKSTRSKSFNFQSKNLMEKSVPLEWMKYQKDVLDSGALGSAEDNAPIGFNPDSGDYKGF
jgi:hypothetical protein